MKRTVPVILWLLAVAVGVVLTIQRYRAAVVGDAGIDLETFVTAANAVRDGGSVYDATGYVYLPPLAWVFLPFPTLEAAIGPWAIISLTACWAAVAAVTATLWSDLNAWQRPAVAGFALATLLYNSVTTLELWLGQNDTLVLLTMAGAVFLASRRWAAASGAAVALGAILKSWPGAMGLWLLRAGAPHRWRAVIGAFATGAGALVIVAIVSGPQTILAWIERTVSFSEQDLVAYSVWGVGRHLFDDSGVMPPLVEAAALGTAVSWILAAVVVAAIVVVLLRPGTDSLSMWNIATAVILLLPVSHLWYRLLMLPLLWVWVAVALRRPRDPLVWASVALAAGAWIVTFRWEPLDNRAAGDPWQFVIVMAAAVALLVVSTCAAARMKPGTAFTPRLRSAEEPLTARPAA